MMRDQQGYAVPDGLLYQDIPARPAGQEFPGRPEFLPGQSETGAVAEDRIFPVEPGRGASARPAADPLFLPDGLHPFALPWLRDLTDGRRGLELA